MKKNIFTISFLLVYILFTQISFSQTAATLRMQQQVKKKTMQQNSMLKNLSFTSIGPTVMSGRVTDLEVNATDPTNFYVAYASGGLFVTKNNGQSFEPIFDKESCITIGDIAVDWKNNETIWVGTGENNSSRSSYSGTGIFKSTDKGKTWQNMGLHESHHIGRIVLNPTNKDIVWVAVLGHLYTNNKERGIYKTIDGGKTWKQILFIDDNTGAVDLVVDPNNASVLYAALWHRERKAWNLTEGGKTSGIYKSIDGGENWKLLTTPSSGFPSGDGTGRIGIAVSYQNSNKLYAYLDNQNKREPDTTKKKKPELRKDSLRVMSKEKFLLVDDTLLSKYLKANDFDDDYDAARIKTMVKADSIKPSALVDYTEDANNDLFDTPVKGGEVYTSDDAGLTWKRTHEKYLDDFVYTYGYYFGQIKVSPVNDKKIITVGVPIIVSENGGKTFTSIDAENMHGDFHAVWINPANEKHLIIGNDGGLNISYDGGKNYMKCNSPAVGQFYTVQVDYAKPYNVYGGLQDNGVWTGPSFYKASNYWHQSGQYPYKTILGGDGMQVMVDSRDNNTVYTGYQFGWYYRVNKTTGKNKLIKPKHKLGERPLRFNWQTPIWLSQHNEDVLYFGTNKFHRSLNQGDKWETLSGDLTKGGKKGDVAFGTVTTIHESSLQFGLIYVGSDDGLVHVTKDGGYTWANISAGLPKELWVSRIIASAYDTATLYAALNGYRNDDFAPYIFMSNNFGKTWKQIGKELPYEPVNVIREDVKNKNILYAGTDNGLYISFDKGITFQAMDNSLPHVAVHDIVIQTEANDLVIGTHGRSLYKINLDVVQQLTSEVPSPTGRDRVGLTTQPLTVFKIKPVKWRAGWGKQNYAWGDTTETKVALHYYSKSNGITTCEILDESKNVLTTLTDTAETGINFFNYNLSYDVVGLANYKNTMLGKKDLKDEDGDAFEKKENGKYYLLPGNYFIRIMQNGIVKEEKMEIVKEKQR